MKAETIIYLRTDLGNQQLQAGGSVGHTLGVIRGYVDAGYTVIVASSALWSVLEKEGLLLYYLRLPFFCRWLGTKISALLSSFFFLPRLLYLMVRYKPTYLYQRYSLLNVSGILAACIMRVPLVLEYNGSEVWIERYWTFRQKLRLIKLIALIEWINLRFATLIVVVSDALRHDLINRDIPAAKIITNPNGVDIQQFNPATLHGARQHTRTKLGLEGNTVVGFIGTFSAWHGINMLGQIIPAVINQQPTIRFLLIGDGQLKQWLAQELHYYKEYIVYTGTVAQEQARDYLAACDMFLCPTQPNADATPFFGSPTKLFEYMSLAKPVIASDLEQVAQIIAPAYKKQQEQWITAANACGLLVDSNDVDGFVQAILMVTCWSEEERRAMGLQAREKIAREYTWHHHVRKIIAHPLL